MSLLRSPTTRSPLRLAALRPWPWLAALALLTACDPSPEPINLSGSAMGTRWSVQLREHPTAVPLSALQAQIEAELERLEQQMSTWRPDSDISRFNRARAGDVLSVPDDFSAVLQAALAVAEASAGAFDPSIGPLVELWGFGPGATDEQVPDPAALAAARAAVGWQRIEFDPASGRLTQPGGLMLDFSAIAKGHAVDRLAAVLETHHIVHYLVEIGGELRSRGQRPDGRGWRIAIERPLAGQQEVQRILAPGDQAMATSGSYRNFFEADGRRHAHAIDPRSGEPIRHRLVSVTVLHASCLQADALATALLVLGPQDGLAFARQQRLAALLLVERDDGGFDQRVTPRFAEMFDVTRAEPAANPDAGSAVAGLDPPRSRAHADRPHPPDRQ
jgi:FAD:protein FMN transferase